jgi:hypothetical protein
MIRIDRLRVGLRIATPRTVSNALVGIQPNRLLWGALEAREFTPTLGGLRSQTVISSLSMPTSPMPDMTWIVGINDMEF